MIYKKYKAPKRFDKHVECLFSWEGLASEGLAIETPPPAFCSIVINYADSYYVSSSKYTRKKVPSSFVAGLAVKNYTLQMSGKIGMVGIVFRPTGLFHYLGKPMFELTGERLALAAVVPRAEFYIKEIRKGKSLEDKLERLLDFLNHLETLGSYASPQITKASNDILAKKGNISITELLSSIFMSRRVFERHFLEEVGLSPKAYSKIRRFAYTCSLMAGKRKVNLAKVLHKGGYYDQSHFIKDFKFFSGRTPKFYVENNMELAHLIQKHELVNT